MTPPLDLDAIRKRAAQPWLTRGFKEGEDWPVIGKAETLALISEVEALRLEAKENSELDNILLDRNETIRSLRVQLAALKEHDAALQEVLKAIRNNDEADRYSYKVAHKALTELESS